MNERLGNSHVQTSNGQRSPGAPADIEEVYIREGFRGHGLGSEFLQFIQEEYRDKAARLRLEVEDDNTGAIRLYERLGYRRLPYSQMIVELNMHDSGKFN